MQSAEPSPLSSWDKQSFGFQVCTCREVCSRFEVSVILMKSCRNTGYENPMPGNFLQILFLKYFVKILHFCRQIYHHLPSDFHRNTVIFPSCLHPNQYGDSLRACPILYSSFSCSIMIQSPVNYTIKDLKFFFTYF